jgi:hypothetical protein
MPIVKKKDGKFVESYEINGFNVSIDQKNVTVIFSKYTVGSSGTPTAEDFSYNIFDRIDRKPAKIKKKVNLPKRSSTGAVILNEAGNPIIEETEVEVDGSEEITINALTEIMIGLTSGKSLYTEIKLALYKSFIKYYLNDSKEYTIE